MTVRKRMRLLHASTMAVAGLVAGITPAHAVSKAQEEFSVGFGYTRVGYNGLYTELEAPRACQFFPVNGEARSAINVSPTSTIKLYGARDAAGNCWDLLAMLGPGERDDGIGTLLGRVGAKFYSTTL